MIDGETRLYSISGFWTLIQLYEERGDLADALKVAEIATGHGQCEEARRTVRRGHNLRLPRIPTLVSHTRHELPIAGNVSTLPKVSLSNKGEDHPHD